MMVFLALFYLSFLSGAGKATRDTISHHWVRSVFIKIKNDAIRQWFYSDWHHRPNHPIWFLWDGWHFGDFISYVGLFGCLLIIEKMWQVGIVISSFYLAFNLLYKKLLLNDDS